MLSPPACPFVCHSVQGKVCRVAFANIEFFGLGPQVKGG